MIRTLHNYLGKDLLKTTALAAVAFTLVITTFAIIEPMRRQGLSGSQAMRMFWYLLPVMLSLTLPIAALLAATMVYGRFSMDNELLACRAGGISVNSLLRPGLAMGAAVSIISLLLSNWIAPALARSGERTVKRNLRGMIYQQLRSRCHVQEGAWILHADSADPDTDSLRGVVAIDVSDADNPEYLVAARAYVQFEEGPDQMGQVSFSLINLHGGRQEYSGDFAGSYESTQWQVGPFLLSPLMKELKEDPTFYDWAMLCAIRRDPQNSPVVKRMLKDIYRQLHVNSLYEEMGEVIMGGTVYELSDESGRRFRFSAPNARVEKGKRLILSGNQQPNSPDRPVVVEVHGNDGRLERIYQCRQAEVQAKYRAMRNAAVVSVELNDRVVSRADEPMAAGARKRRDRLSELQVPAGMENRLAGVDLAMLYSHEELFPAVRSELAQLNKYIKNTLMLNILAEMHGRIAYGIGCFLLVAAGAALGLIYRGGQLLSAFALSCIPAMILVVMTIMGKQIVQNPGASCMFGLAAIWSGTGILVVMVAYLYGFALRR
ncbi:MAG: YjgP/YjgQ family permease [Planctomycetes bacterium]|nr:YjgP/YjgQ family permease [Planctomycetota bacterium]